MFHSSVDHVPSPPSGPPARLRLLPYPSDCYPQVLTPVAVCEYNGTDEPDCRRFVADCGSCPLAADMTPQVRPPGPKGPRQPPCSSHMVNGWTMAPRNAISARTTVFKPKRDHYSTDSCCASTSSRLPDWGWGFTGCVPCQASNRTPGPFPAHGHQAPTINWGLGAQLTRTHEPTL